MLRGRFLRRSGRAVDDRRDVLRQVALGTLNDLEGHPGALLERAEAVHLDGREMGEHVVAAALQREPIPFCRGCHAPEANATMPTVATELGVACVTCHVTTTVMADRLSIANVSAGTLTSRFTSTQFDLTPLGEDSARFRTLRALGWIRSSPLVAQRTVNETANVIAEIEARFPPAR